LEPGMLAELIDCLSRKKTIYFMIKILSRVSVRIACTRAAKIMRPMIASPPISSSNDYTLSDTTPLKFDICSRLYLDTYTSSMTSSRTRSVIDEKEITEEYCIPLAGRFLVSTTEGLFSTHLTHETRRLAWVTSGLELFKLHGKQALKVAEYLQFTGHILEDLRKHRRAMRLYLFSSNFITLCTWDNFLQLIYRAYGDSIGKYLMKHSLALQLIPFHEIALEDQTYDIIALDKDYANPARLNPERYLLTGNRLIDARAFLYHEFEFADLPYTSSDPAKRVEAYMVQNNALRNICSDENWIQIL